MPGAVSEPPPLCYPAASQLPPDEPQAALWGRFRLFLHPHPE